MRRPVELNDSSDDQMDDEEVHQSNLSDSDDHDDSPLHSTEAGRSFNELLNSISDLNNRVYVDSDGEEYTEEDINALQSSISSLPSSPNNTNSQVLNSFMMSLMQLVRDGHYEYNGSPIQLEPMQGQPITTVEVSTVSVERNEPSSWSNDLINTLEASIEHVLLSQPSMLQIEALPVLVRPRRLGRRFYQSSANHVALQFVGFTEDEYNLARSHLHRSIQEMYSRENIRWVNLQINVLNVCLEVWHVHHRSFMPSFHEVVRRIVQETFAFVPMPLEEAIVQDIFSFWIRTNGFIPYITDLELIYEYYLIHQQTYPTIEQLDNMILRSLQFSLDPERFYNEDRILVPALNIDQIPRYPNQDPSLVCSICQEDIKINQQVLTLPPCNHRFHAMSTDCLESGCILTWLSGHNSCPMCKTKIEVPLGNESN